MLLAFPQVEKIRFCQGLLGAMSPKPTNLLLLNLPDFILTLHSHRVRTENPKAVAIGKSSSGQWRAAGSKEYPPSFCRSIVQAFCDAIFQRVIDETAPVPDDEFTRGCTDLVMTTYGDHIGHDFAAFGKIDACGFSCFPKPKNLETSLAAA